MSSAVIGLIATLTVWMGLCAWCGYQFRFIRFLAVLIAGLGVYMLWMMAVLNAKPLEPSAIMALSAAVLFGASAFGCGYLAGRLARQFRAAGLRIRSV